mmetsp:Transcript_1563/g.4098  ORF Transcript_1563/g.4098 Transcript_1563/m.4098 type:complete len:121 (+) Transcript_1563:161-523(+)
MVTDHFSCKGDGNFQQSNYNGTHIKSLKRAGLAERYSALHTKIIPINSRIQKAETSNTITLENGSDSLSEKLVGRNSFHSVEIYFFRKAILWSTHRFVSKKPRNPHRSLKLTVRNNRNKC